MKELHYSQLCDIYGTMLTERQRGVVRDYYDFDLSLAEIADKLGTSRQSVRTIRLQAESVLSDCEQKLSLLETLGVAKGFLAQEQWETLRTLICKCN